MIEVLKQEGRYRITKDTHIEIAAASYEIDWNDYQDGRWFSDAEDAMGMHYYEEYNEVLERGQGTIVRQPGYYFYENYYNGDATRVESEEELVNMLVHWILNL